jgi:hypothetical protein
MISWIGDVVQFRPGDHRPPAPHQLSLAMTPAPAQVYRTVDGSILLAWRQVSGSWTRTAWNERAKELLVTGVVQYGDY